MATVEADITPLDRELRSHICTEEAARHLNRRPQTLRLWAASEAYPEGLQPVRVLGRLHWPVAGIRSVLGLDEEAQA